MMVNTKNKTGYGKPIVVHYFASFSEDGRIVNDYNAIGDDVEMIQEERLEDYCLK